MPQAGHVCAQCMRRFVCWEVSAGGCVGVAVCDRTLVACDRLGVGERFAGDSLCRDGFTVWASLPCAGEQVLRCGLELCGLQGPVAAPM